VRALFAENKVFCTCGTTMVYMEAAMAIQTKKCDTDSNAHTA